MKKREKYKKKAPPSFPPCPGNQPDSPQHPAPTGATHATARGSDIGVNQRRPNGERNAGSNLGGGKNRHKKGCKARPLVAQHAQLCHSDETRRSRAPGLGQNSDPADRARPRPGTSTLSIAPDSRRPFAPTNPLAPPNADRAGTPVGGEQLAKAGRQTARPERPRNATKHPVNHFEWLRCCVSSGPTRSPPADSGSALRSRLGRRTKDTQPGPRGGVKRPTYASKRRVREGERKPVNKIVYLFCCCWPWFILLFCCFCFPSRRFADLAPRREAWRARRAPRSRSRLLRGRGKFIGSWIARIGRPRFQIHTQKKKTRRGGANRKKKTSPTPFGRSHDLFYFVRRLTLFQGPSCRYGFAWGN